MHPGAQRRAGGRRGQGAGTGRRAAGAGRTRHQFGSPSSLTCRASRPLLPEVPVHPVTPPVPCRSCQAIRRLCPSSLPPEMLLWWCCIRQGSTRGCVPQAEHRTPACASRRISRTTGSALFASPKPPDPQAAAFWVTSDQRQRNPCACHLEHNKAELAGTAPRCRLIYCRLPGA